MQGNRIISVNFDEIVKLFLACFHIKYDYKSKLGFKHNLKYKGYQLHQGFHTHFFDNLITAINCLCNHNLSIEENSRFRIYVVEIKTNAHFKFERTTIRRNTKSRSIHLYKASIHEKFVAQNEIIGVHVYRGSHQNKKLKKFFSPPKRKIFEFTCDNKWPEEMQQKQAVDKCLIS